MHTFVWSAQYATGIEVVDSQHQHLVELINEFAESVTNHEVSPVQAEATFEALSAYATEHFRSEEALMLEKGLDVRSLERHHHLHEGFLAELALMHATVADGNHDAEAGRMLMHFLVSWLAFHILGTDHEMARQFKHLEQGKTAAEAWAAEVREVEPGGVLLGAIDDLLRVVATRNQELQQANATLEARVVERTAALAAAIENLKLTQRSLVESAKLASVGQLAAGLAHEINNPLAFVKPNVEFLALVVERQGRALREYQASEPPPNREARLRAEAAGVRERSVDLEQLEKEIPGLLADTNNGLARIAQVVRDMKDFSRVDGHTQPVDVSRALDTAFAVVPEPRKAGVIINRAYDSQLPAVRCSAAQLGQTLVSLLTNAFQAVSTTHERTLSVKTSHTGGRVSIEVIDTGVGMSAEVKAHLFEPFFTTRAPGEGFGLGLSAAWQFAQHHEGTLEVESDAGQGTRVRLVLPVEGPLRQHGVVARSESYNERRR